MLRRLIVGDNERVLVIRSKRFQGILGPGKYWIVGAGVAFERHNVREIVFTSEWADFLGKERPDETSTYFRVFETNDQGGRGRVLRREAGAQRRTG